SGTVVGTADGKIISDPNYASAYCIELNDTLSLEPRTPFRYLNHCCTPNCRLVIVEPPLDSDSPIPEVQIETIASIPQNGELTIDYQWSADDAIKCLCNSQQCRGWVVAADELPKLLGSRKLTGTNLS
ncbi:MAG: SET domain-containing protein, partial [Planctomycetes bacterium]|nr:SET domain-containing protein [Planctomycetota bacterium]